MDLEVFTSGILARHSTVGRSFVIASCICLRPGGTGWLCMHMAGIGVLQGPGVVLKCGVAEQFHLLCIQAAARSDRVVVDVWVDASGDKVY